MKCNKKIYFLLILVMVMVLVPFNVIAEETIQTPEGTENTETEEPVVPGTPTEDEITTPDEGDTSKENTEDNATTQPPEDPEIKEEEKTDTDTKTEENVNTEENKKEETTEKNDKEQEKEKKEDEKTNTTTKRPNVDYSTTIIDNAKKRVEISILGEDNQLLSGVKFQIQDKNGNIFYEEETTEEIFVFEQMELGTYYLVQVSTLEGYAKNTEKIEFVVSEESETVKVELINKLETEKEETKKQKDVFGMELPLLSSIAMFDIALVIGIIVYVRKNKKVKDKK
ncbi:MAG: hypothetical protein IJY25_00755 [Bacilli bacterium]|nr:hypothetical protein [Bacilli bacterium]